MIFLLRRIIRRKETFYKEKNLFDIEILMNKLSYVHHIILKKMEMSSSFTFAEWNDKHF